MPRCDRDAAGRNLAGGLYGDGRPGRLLLPMSPLHPGPQAELAQPQDHRADRLPRQRASVHLHCGGMMPGWTWRRVAPARPGSSS